MDDRHVTIRVIVSVFFAALVVISVIFGCVYTAHENNQKTTKYGVECMRQGGEWREANNGTAYCDQ